MFLTREQLLELTGYRQPGRQVAWLRKNGIEHYVRADGRPAVPAAAIAPEPVGGQGRVEPNFDAIPARH